MSDNGKDIYDPNFEISTWSNLDLVKQVIKKSQEKQMEVVPTILKSRVTNLTPSP